MGTHVAQLCGPAFHHTLVKSRHMNREAYATNVQVMWTHVYNGNSGVEEGQWGPFGT